MSWDVSVQRFSREYDTVAEIPETERCFVLGSRTEVSAAISRHFPGTNWTDSACGVFDFADGSIEFSLGESDPCDGFVMHIRASSAVVPTLVAMCIAERWQALDWSTNEFLERMAEPSAGLKQWRQFRDEVVADT